MLYFENDYSEGAHEEVLKRLIETNMEQLPGYGTDRYTFICKGKDLCRLRMSGRRGVFSDRRYADKPDRDQRHAGFP